MKNKGGLSKIILTSAAIILIALGVYFFLDDFLKLCMWIIGIFLPFIVAYFVSLLVNPIVNKLGKKIKIPRNILTVIVILLTVGIIGGVIFAIVWKIVDEIQSMYHQIPDIISGIKSLCAELSKKYSSIISTLPKSVQESFSESGDGLLKSLTKLITTSYSPIVNGIGHTAKALPKIFIWVIVFLLSLYFMVTDAEALKRVMGKFTSEKLALRIENVRDELKRYAGGYVKAQLIIMCVVFFIILVGLTAMGVNFAFLIAIGIAVLDALPFFGTGAVLWPWSIISFATGDVIRGIGMLVIYIIVMVTRQIIEPKIVSSNIGIYPVFTLMSMYVGYSIFSIGGMILGPIILMLVVSFYKAGAFDEIFAFTGRNLKRAWEEIKELFSFLK